MLASSVSVQADDFDLGAEAAALRAAHPGVGAVVAFVGTVRDRNDGATVSAMELEHYPGMTERSIASVAEAAHRRFDIVASRIVHRIGVLQPQDQIVLVAVCAAHRGTAFAACEYLIDYLKTEAPFWKKETTPDGARWVDARVSDDAALEKWSQESDSRAVGERRGSASAGQSEIVAVGGGGAGHPPSTAHAESENLAGS